MVLIFYTNPMKETILSSEFWGKQYFLLSFVGYLQVCMPGTKTPNSIPSFLFNLASPQQDGLHLG